jgi:dUTP pyrophosphatase
LALKNGVHVLNAPGTIDSDYRGEVGIILHNSSSEPFVIQFGDRIAQAVVAQTIRANFIIKPLPQTENTARGEGGFGSTGVK